MMTHVKPQLPVYDELHEEAIPTWVYVVVSGLLDTRTEGTALYGTDIYTSPDNYLAFRREINDVSPSHSGLRERGSYQLREYPMSDGDYREAYAIAQAIVAEHDDKALAVANEMVKARDLAQLARLRKEQR